jgi:hypothetical protein
MTVANKIINDLIKVYSEYFCNEWSPDFLNVFNPDNAKSRHSVYLNTSKALNFGSNPTTIYVYVCIHIKICNFDI